MNFVTLNGWKALNSETSDQAINNDRKLNSSSENKLRNTLREKCSFHLLKPMVESYLFGDANALKLCGVPVGSNPKLLHPSDVEQFETTDPAWLPLCHSENTQKQKTHSWWRHECHPKHYLEHLVILGGQDYGETQNGKTALKKLDWKNVPKCPADIPIIRALFEDISDWFGIANPLPGTTDLNFYPAKTVNRKNLLLRNM